jgi:16S rRNA (guanine527-N7)-methyltransferase
VADELDRVLDDARSLGFLGPGVAADHRRHAEGFLGLLDGLAVTDAVDLGSGGGVPGLVLAAALPRSRWTLLDAMRKRTAFLAVAVERLGLQDRVTVRTGRAEELARDPALRGRADAVVARGFAPPAVTAECGAPLLRHGGVLVVSEPPGGADRWPPAPLIDLGLVLDRQEAGPPALVRLRLVEAVPDRFPRRTGVPAKRPLW